MASVVESCRKVSEFDCMHSDRIQDVPEVYLWRRDSSETATDDELPVVDMSGKIQNDEVRNACETYGAFQIVNHGISQELLERMQEQSTRMFYLPLEKKMETKRLPGSFSGYGTAQHSKFSQKLFWSEGFTIAGSPAPLASQLWPLHPDSFCEVVEEYNMAMSRLARKVLRVMLEGLGLSEEECKWCRNEQDYFAALQLNHYPPSPSPLQTMGMAEHTDSTLLTILYQHNSPSVRGLQVRRSDGSWMWVQPLPHALVVNIGDLLQVVSNGRYRGVMHRVGSSGRRRMSVAYLWGPPMEETVECLDELVDAENPRLYEALTWRQYLGARSTHFSNALDLFATSNKSYDPTNS